jgi:hypothetical protein
MMTFEQKLKLSEQREKEHRKKEEERKQAKCYKRNMEIVNALSYTTRELGRHGPRRDKTSRPKVAPHFCTDDGCELCCLRGKNMTQIRLLSKIAATLAH